MIDKKVFTREMALLLERFDRKMSNPVIARYYETLNARLNTSQFELAARRVFDEETFFPAPQAFLAKLDDGPEADAEADWTAVLNAATQGSQELRGLSEPARYALRAIGGIAKLGRANIDYEVPRLKKAFLNAYPAGHNRHANQQVRELFQLEDGQAPRELPE